MARSFRFYEKKRGHRRTGSRQLGSAGELIFFSALLLIGLVGAVAMVRTFVVPEWRANHEFLKHTCVVLDKRIGQSDGNEGKLFRPEIEIEYEVAGVKHRPWVYDIAGAYSSRRDDAQEVLDGFIVDRQSPREYPCWYDPVNPERAVLVRGYSWWVWPVALIWLAFVVVGSGGLLYTWLHWNKSAERRAAFAKRVSEGDIFRANGRGSREFPYVPVGEDITNSPGTRLKFRLPMGASPGWKVLATLLIALVWNGIVLVWAVMAINDFRAGNPNWLTEALFLIPFVAAGIGLLAWFMRQLLIATGIGPTHVEISDHPLTPGTSYRLFITQPGRLKFNSLAVWLICEEEATYRQGTNIRNESCEVFRQSLLRRESFEVQPGTPFEVDFSFVAPADAMHSFKAHNNSVSWKVVVEGDVANWPNYTREFPVIVRPARGIVAS